MKLLFEGTEEEIDNLKWLVEKSKLNLPLVNPNYQVENLWSIFDVQSKFECTEDEAMGVLIKALKNDATMEQIWFAIDFHGEDMGLKKINEE